LTLHPPIDVKIGMVRFDVFVHSAQGIYDVFAVVLFFQVGEDQVVLVAF
jgi:hypothetical protein